LFICVIQNARICHQAHIVECYADQHRRNTGEKRMCFECGAQPITRCRGSTRCNDEEVRICLACNEESILLIGGVDDNKAPASKLACTPGPPRGVRIDIQDERRLQVAIDRWVPDRRVPAVLALVPLHWA
jgi:hypothetical protein